MKPIFSTYIIKKRAKEGMRRGFFKALAVTFIPALIISTVACGIMMMLPGAENTADLILSGNIEKLETVFDNFSMATGLLGALFAFLSIGSAGATLDMIRGKEVKVRNVFRYYGKWYIAVIYPLCTFAYTYLSEYVSSYLTATGVSDVTVGIISGIFNAAAYVVSLKLMFFEYALSDCECSDIKKAFSEAWSMTGITTVANSITLAFSFLLWAVGVTVTGGVLLIYVYPYLAFSRAALYDLNLEYRNSARDKV